MCEKSEVIRSKIDTIDFFQVIITIIKEFCKKLAITTLSYNCADRIAHCDLFALSDVPFGCTIREISTIL